MFVFKDVLDLYADNDVFFLVAHSFGTLLTLEIAKTLESRGRIGKVVMIDGSPLFFKHFSESLGGTEAPEEFIQNEILTTLVRMDFPEKHQEIMKDALSGSDFESKLDSFIAFYQSSKSFERKYSKEWIVALFRRFKMAKTLNEAAFSYLKSTKISLVVPSDKLFNDLPEDYNLNRYCSQTVDTLVINGNHLSILQHAELSKFINSLK